MVKHGFAIQMEDVTVNVPDEQKKHILDVDESALLMGGSTHEKGGHPSVTFYDRSLPVNGFIASKRSQATTLIIGSRDAMIVLPPRFLFSATSKSEECAHFCLETVKFMENVIGQCGYDEVKGFPCTFGLNEKRGMDKKEFEKYIFTNIIPLYHDAKDVPGKGSVSNLTVDRDKSMPS